MDNGFRTDRTVALVIDLQNENRDNGAWPVAGYRDVLENAKQAINACRTNGVPIIYSQHWLDPRGTNAMKYEPLREDGCPTHSVAGDPMGEICDIVAPEPEDIVIAKQRFTAFYNTQLDLVLNKLDVNHLIVMGVWTEACLETTVWDALWRDYRITLVKDACGSSTDAVHKCAMLDMANWLYGGTIVAAGELAKALDGKDFVAWHFSEPNTYPYTLDTVEAMYDSL